MMVIEEGGLRNKPEMEEILGLIRTGMQGAYQGQVVLKSLLHLGFSKPRVTL